MRRQEDSDLPDTAGLIASMLSLMTGFARLRCPRQAVLIERQLAYLQSYPDSLMPPLLKAAAKRLRGEWQRILFDLPCKHSPPPAGGETADQPFLH